MAAYFYLMFWYILIALIATLVLWVLLIPLLLVVDTERNRYVAGLPGLAGVVAVPDSGLFYLRIWILFIPVRFDPFKGKRRESGEEKEEEEPKKKRSRKKENRQKGMRMFRAFIRSARVRKLELDLDTDDYPLNAQLIPVFTALNGDQIRMRINFEGYMALKFHSHLRLGSLLYNYIKNK